MSGCRCTSSPGSSGGVGVGLVLATLAAVGVAVYAVVVVLMGVFSWHGLAYSLFLADADELRFAPAVRLVTLTGLGELGVAGSMLLDYRDGRRQLELRWAWLVGHITLVRRTIVAALWLPASAATLACDLWYHRERVLLPLSLTLRQIGRVFADRWADLAYALTAMCGPSGWRRARREHRAVQPTPLHGGSRFTGMVVEGSIVAPSPWAA